MGKSFFRGTDAEVYSGSHAFSAKINESGSAYGISPELAAQYALLDADYAAAYLASQNPGLRTTSRVIEKNDSKARLMSMASDLAKIIGGSGVSDGEMIALGLSVRATPAPLPPPGRPDEFRVRLLGDGSWELTWKCKNPPGSRGTIYHVWRRVGGEGEFTPLGITGKRSYVEREVAAGFSQVTYRIQAVRSKAVGQWGYYTVNVGTTSSLPLRLNAA